MTSDQMTLPVPATEPDHAQWRLETMQLVNWGGFHGYTPASPSLPAPLC